MMQVLPLSASSQLKGQWSELKTVKVPFLSPVQMASWDCLSRGGGEQTHLAPSNPGTSRLSRVRKRYWGQVSAKMG